MLKDAYVFCTNFEISWHTSKPYTLSTDASKHGWAGELIQMHTSTVNGKEAIMDHPVSHASGLFHGSQFNWAALMKEA